MFSTYVIKDKYYETFLSCSRLSAESDISASLQRTFVSETLDVLSKTGTNVVCVIGDNCSVNNRLSSLTSIPLIGCYSHKFNLAVEEWITNQLGCRMSLRRFVSLWFNLELLRMQQTFVSSPILGLSSRMRRDGLGSFK